jgi:putative ABC transport system permease protein
MDTILQDVRYAVRQLTRSPGFAVAAVLTLALGIGANAAIFSVVDAALLRPLPYPHAEAIVRAYELMGTDAWSTSPTDFVDFRAQNRSLSELAAIDAYPRTLTGSGLEPLPIPSARVSGGFFDVMGVAPALGRPFVAAETQYGQTQAVVISDGLWHSRFGSQPDIVGRTILLDGKSCAVVGVMPAGFNYPAGVQMWTPLAFSDTDLATQRGAHYLDLVGRLKPGVTMDQATADLQGIATRLAQDYPKTNQGQGATLVTLRQALIGRNIRTALLVLLGAVGLVVLIACANVANLLLARAAGRARELAVRVALGAGRGDLIRQALTESVVLAAAGGILGLLLSTWITGALSALRPVALRNVGALGVDGAVLAFTAGVVLLTGLLFGLVPALQASRAADLHTTLQTGGRAQITTREGWRLRSGLISAELALAVILLTGAGLLLKSFARLERVDPGFDSRGVLTFQLSLPDVRYPKPEQAGIFYDQLLTSVRALPGVERASAISGLPLDDYGFSISMTTLDGRPVESHAAPSPQIRLVTPGLFRTLGMRLAAGRDFTSSDRTGAPLVVVVNEAAARAIWPGVDPLGHTLEVGTKFGLGGARGGGQVIGVVRDVHDAGLGADPRPTVYLAHAQFPVTDLAIAVRSAGSIDPLSLTSSVRAALSRLDPDLPMDQVRSLDRLAATSVAQPRFAMLLLSSFAAIALALAAVGMYGVMAYVVSQRRHDIGIRMALGASRAAVVSEVVARAARPVGVGLVIGLAGALVLSRTLSRLLYEIKPSDPLTYLFVALTLSVIALTAAYLPALRASRVDPAFALRSE